MFNLVQFIKKQAGDLVDDHKKEKTASSAQGLSGTIKLPKLDVKPAPVSGKSAVHDATSTPSVGRNQSAPRPQRTQKITKIPRPLSKIAYKRNTGVVDVDGLPYTNTDDVELLSKLGYSVDKEHYLFLPMGESKEDLYSYVEKCAEVPKIPSQAIDKGEAFSGEYLKDMDYEIPKGYEIKGDLVCPVEKTRKEEKESAEKTAAADPSQTILITGHSGAGKTTLSRQLAEQLNIPVRRVDAHRGWDNYIRGDDKRWKETLTPGTKEHSYFTDLVHRATRDTIKNAPKAGIIEGAQLGHLSPEELAKFKAHIVVGGSRDQSILQRIQRSVNKASKEGVTFSPEEMINKKIKAQYVADYWEPGVDKFRKLPGVIQYNHTEHKIEPLIKQIQQLMSKKAEATHELKSSNIKAVGYNKENKSLDVAFHSGGNYTYKDVPKSLFDRIKRVKSPGKFFHKHIKRDNPYSYERIEKESEYKLHWSKDLHKDVTNNRHYPFSFLTGEAKELVDAIKNRDWANFKEEIGDSTYAAQMLAAQATGLNHPVYADLSKHYDREKVWKDMFKEKGSSYHPKHMQGGSNYAKASKIIKAFASAGIKVDQREAERLANKYTGGKMEKEANVIVPRPGTVTNLEAYKEPLPSKMDMLGTILLGDAYMPTPRNQESMLEAKQRNRRNVDMGYLDTDTAKAIGEKISPFLGGNPVKARLDLERMQQDPNIMSQFKQANSILDKMQNKIYKQIEYAS
jgi:adenylate kinase family enzyme/NTP pyrophosphatase (non-canonical NTP hydrolase)